MADVSIDVLFFLDPQFSFVNPPFDSDCDCIWTEKNHFNAVLKSASSSPMILKVWIFRTPFFFSSMQSVSFSHRALMNPYMKGKLIMMHKNSAQ